MAFLLMLRVWLRLLSEYFFCLSVLISVKWVFAVKVDMLTC
jgi:hypothetical protein